MNGHPHVPWAALAAALLLSGCASVPQTATSSPPTAVNVEVITLQSSPMKQTYEAPGSVRAGQRAVLASKIQGTIRSASVQLGHTVQAGQALMQLDDAELAAEAARAEAAQNAAQHRSLELKAGLESAQAEADLAAITFKRYQELFGKRSVSQQELDQMTARNHSAQANLASARARIEEARAHEQEAAAAVAAAQVRKGYSQITAPFAGVVSEKNADAGTLVSPGMPLLTIDDLGSYQLEVFLPEAHLQEAKVGVMVQVSVPSVGLRAPAKIAEVQAAADASSHSFLVRIRLPQADGLRTGLFGRAVFSLATMSTLTVPEQATVRQGQLTSVFVVTEGRARRRLITVGRRSDAQAEVLSGLSDGEQVVVSDLSELADGSPVEIRP
jgi:membrane fusion protein, multidrug efflux system